MRRASIGSRRSAKYGEVQKNTDMVPYEGWSKLGLDPESTKRSRDRIVAQAVEQGIDPAKALKGLGFVYSAPVETEEEITPRSRPKSRPLPARILILIGVVWCCDKVWNWGASFGAVRIIEIILMIFAVLGAMKMFAFAGANGKRGNW